MLRAMVVPPGPARVVTARFMPALMSAAVKALATPTLTVSGTASAIVWPSRVFTFSVLVAASKLTIVPRMFVAGGSAAAAGAPPPAAGGAAGAAGAAANDGAARNATARAAAANVTM